MSKIQELIEQHEQEKARQARENLAWQLAFAEIDRQAKKAVPALPTHANALQRAGQSPEDKIRHDIWHYFQAEEGDE